MKKSVKNSLTAKVFLLTIVLLLLTSAVTYLGIAKYLPSAYSSQLTEALQQASRQLGKELENFSSVAEASSMLVYFEASNQANITILDNSGNAVYPVPLTVQDMAVQESHAEETAIESTMELQESPQSGKHYEITVGDRPYTMLVQGTMQAVSQTAEILRQIFPYLFCAIAVLALLCSFLTYLYLTRPIVRISAISRKMADLNFDETCLEGRADEVGILAQSLNELSGSLSASMHSLEKSNRELKSDMERERESERRRTAFFAAVSHELKTPVTILKGHLWGMMQNLDTYQDHSHYLRRSYEVTDTMEQMVQEILTVSRMESTDAPARKEETDLSELIRLQTAELIELLEQKELSWNLQIPDHLRVPVQTSMMVKVFRNLLVNAVRYTPYGGRVHIFMEEDTFGIHFYIENSGTRLPDESIPRIFDAFYRVESSRNRSTGGSGLGLYIVKMILVQHRAEFGVQNTSGGVRFWFDLPPSVSI